MSALGQKQTYAVQKAMSALPPKADIGAAQINVRFGPEADIAWWHSSKNLLFQIKENAIRIAAAITPPTAITMSARPTVDIASTLHFERMVQRGRLPVLKDPERKRAAG